MATKKTMTKAAATGEAPASVSKDLRTASVHIPMSKGSSTGDREFVQAVAKRLTRPDVCAAAIIEQWQNDTHDVNALADELARQIEAVNGGDLRRAEGMLIAQAHALDNIFSNLARRATGQSYLTQWEAYMRMAMKAQNQCRMTLETLAAIKNPPVVFARQANIAHGPQQVNNGPAPAAASASPGGTMSREAEAGGVQSPPELGPVTELDPTRGVIPAFENNQSYSSATASAAEMRVI
jgi:hypothetical protein